jgi:hypothetical protein
MDNLAYLLIAIGLSVVGSLVLWYRHSRPKSLEAGIDEFDRGLMALAPDGSHKES